MSKGLKRTLLIATACFPIVYFSIVELMEKWNDTSKWPVLDPCTCTGTPEDPCPDGIYCVDSGLDASEGKFWPKEKR